ncbi:MAG: hypothetical protein IT162_23680 [Bryobacterales bacterium]|nr:hypothetical protein [Bryobacterales bacterium]
MRLFILLALLSTALLPAAPVLTIGEPDIRVQPGLAGRWRFELTADSQYWLSTTASFLLFETNPSIGFYSDEIGVAGGPVGGVLPPNGPAWVGDLGVYSIEAAAPAGALNTATVFVLYDLFSADPRTCGVCYVSSGEFQTELSVTVAEVPEPAAMQLASVGAALLAFAARYGRVR